jgi:hypothetical protein
MVKITPMAVDDIINQESNTTGATNSQSSSSLPQKKSVTVEDSMEVISELISEIQSTDKLEVNITPLPPLSSQRKPSEVGSYRFSLTNIL